MQGATDIDAIEAAHIDVIARSITELEADEEEPSPPHHSAKMTIHRRNKKYRVPKVTYLRETQQLGKGIRIPTGRLEKIQATAKQAILEQERAAKAAVGECQPASMSDPLIGLGKSVAMATVTADGKYVWWAGRVQQMFRRSGGSTGNYVQTSEDVMYDTAREEKMKVVCTWYNKHAGYKFTYDGPVDAERYDMGYCLGLLDLGLPNERGQYELRDPQQGPHLDEALKLTMPSLKKGSKRTRGEEQLVAEAKRRRESGISPEAEAAKKRSSAAQNNARSERAGKGLPGQRAAHQPPAAAPSSAAPPSRTTSAPSSVTSMLKAPSTKSLATSAARSAASSTASSGKAANSPSTTSSSTASNVGPHPALCF